MSSSIFIVYYILKNSLWPPGKVFMLFCHLLIVQNQLFPKLLSGISSECQTDWIQIRPDKMSGLIWVQSVCKGHQQTTLLSNELKMKILFPVFFVIIFFNCFGYMIFTFFSSNPMGRTGIRGKGVLWRWGPNHVIKAVVTRWRRKYTADLLPTPAYLYVDGKRVLEFISIAKQDEVSESISDGSYGLPGVCLSLSLMLQIDSG